DCDDLPIERQALSRGAAVERHLGSGKRFAAFEPAEVREYRYENHVGNPVPSHSRGHAHLKPTGVELRPAAELQPAQLVFVVANKDERCSYGTITTVGDAAHLHTMVTAPHARR